MRSILKIVAAFLVGTILAFMVAEIGTRVYLTIRGSSEEYTWEAASRWRSIHRLSKNKDLLYDLVPGATITVDYGGRGDIEYAISSQGIRDKLYQVPKRQDTKRILVIGDSVTFGYYVPGESTFVARVERYLNKDVGYVEVLNGGVGGYNTHNEIAWLVEHGLGFEPDIVILAFCPNDVDNPYFHFTWHTLDKLGRLPPALLPDPELMRGNGMEPPGGLGVFLSKRLRVVSLVQSRVTTLRQALVARALWNGTIQEEAGLARLPFGECLLSLCSESSNRVTWLRHEMAGLDLLSRERNFTWALLALPMSYQRRDGPAVCARKQLLQLAGEFDVPFIDPLETQPGNFRYLFYDVTHLTPLGHEWVAGAVAEAIKGQCLASQTHGAATG